MIEKFDVQIIRLKTGEDLISFCYKDTNNGIIHLKYPKTFYASFDTESDDEELILMDWLPKQAYASQQIKFSTKQILFVTLPTVNFGCEYLTSLMEYLDPESDLSIKIKNTLGSMTSKTPIKDTSILH